MLLSEVANSTVKSHSVTLKASYVEPIDGANNEVEAHVYLPVYRGVRIASSCKSCDLYSAFPNRDDGNNYILTMPDRDLVFGCD